MPQSDARGPVANQVWLEVRNDSSETVPAFGVMRITGATTIETGRQVITIDKPNTSDANYIINSHLPIASDGFGVGTMTFPTMAMYDTGGTPALNEEWGPEDAQWHMASGGSGYNVLGGIETSRMLVKSSGGGSGSDILLCQVNESPSGVVSADATFAVDTISVISGTYDATANPDITDVQNTFAQDMSDNEEIIIVKNTSTDPDQWEVLEQITAGAGKVKVDASDTLDFLEGQFKDHNAVPAYAAGDVIVQVDSVDTGTDPALRLFIDDAEIGKVMVDATDALDYLEDQFVDKTASAFASATDVVVRSNTVSEQIKLYAAMDSISGYSGSGTQFLANVSGTIQWVSLETFTGVTDWQVSGLTVQVKTNTIEGYNLGTESGWTTKHTGSDCSTGEPGVGEALAFG